MNYITRSVGFPLYIVLTIIYISVFLNTNLTAQPKHEKVFKFHPPTLDPTYGMTASIPLHRSKHFKGNDEYYLLHMSISPKKVSAPLGEMKISGAETLVGPKKGLAIILPSTSSADTQHALIFDFGQELAGRLQVWGTKNANLIVTAGESLQECTHQEPTLDNHGPFKITLEGTQPASTPYTAFRYARIEYNGAKPLHLKQVRCDFKYYPVKYTGSFNCSYSLLNRIWYTGAYTAHLCMQEEIWDAPKRDRGLWIGDLQVTGQTINVAFGDKFLMERSIERVRDQAQGKRPDNELPVSEVNSSPGYSELGFAP